MAKLSSENGKFMHWQRKKFDRIAFWIINTRKKYFKQILRRKNKMFLSLQ